MSQSKCCKQFNGSVFCFLIGRCSGYLRHVTRHSDTSFRTINTRGQLILNDRRIYNYDFIRFRKK